MGWKNGRENCCSPGETPLRLRSNFFRYWHTLRFLRLEQFIYRAWFRLYKAKVDFRPAPKTRNLGSFWVKPVARAPSLFDEQSFKFLNVTGVLDDIGWDGLQREKLWRYNQHYFDDLNAKGAAERSVWHRKLLSDWLEANPPAHGSGWEPYPTSIRIVNWIKWSLAGNSLNEGCLNSLAIQVRWLRCRLERHLLGNHLFTNGKALVFAGLFFEGPEASAWLRCGVRLLARELPEQVLADGGHFERSPMYHALALEDILDLTNLLRVGKDLGEVAMLLPMLEESVPRMLNWLLTMCHPDGELSFFNDAALDIAPSPDSLFAYARRLGFGNGRPAEPLPASEKKKSLPVITALQPSGYVRIDAPSASALIDVAPIGPDYLPGHAHADTLSFELSAFGQRLFVNSGTSVYGLSEERLRQRGTAAHNTVIVDEVNSSEVWSGFRVARRARPSNLEIERFARHVRVSCGHTGYQQTIKPPVTHVRQWVMTARELKISDVLRPSVAAYSHPAKARYHLHPAVRIISDDLSSSVTLRLPDGQDIQFVAFVGISVEAATWHPRFGVSEPTSCIVLPLVEGAASAIIRWGNQ